MKTLEYIRSRLSSVARDPKRPNIVVFYTNGNAFIVSTRVGIEPCAISGHWAIIDVGDYQGEARRTLEAVGHSDSVVGTVKLSVLSSEDTQPDDLITIRFPFTGRLHIPAYRLLILEGGVVGD